MHVVVAFSAGGCEVVLDTPSYIVVSIVEAPQ